MKHPKEQQQVEEHENTILLGAGHDGLLPFSRRISTGDHVGRLSTNRRSHWGAANKKRTNASCNIIVAQYHCGALNNATRMVWMNDTHTSIILYSSIWQRMKHRAAHLTFVGPIYLNVQVALREILLLIVFFLFSIVCDRQPAIIEEANISHTEATSNKNSSTTVGV